MKDGITATNDTQEVPMEEPNWRKKEHVFYETAKVLVSLVTEI